MIGKLDPRSKDVTVVGAGISGLFAAYYLDRTGYRVHLIDAAERGGGLITTRATPLGLVEGAAHSVRATPVITELCADLGIELCRLRPEARAKFIFRRGKLRKFPLSPLEAIAAVLRAWLVLAPARDPESLTLEDWATRFLGVKALRYLMTPVVGGIYGASPSEISVSAAFPALCVPRGHSLLSFLLAKKWRKSPPSGVKRPLQRFPSGGIAAPREGMQSLTDALERRLEERLGERFRRHTRAQDLATLPARGNIVLCVPAREAGALLERESPELSAMLAKVRYSPLTTATIFAEAREFRREPRGLGVLVPAHERRKCLGILFNSCQFPARVSREGLVSLTMMMDENVPGPGAPKLDEVIREELQAILGFKGAPLEIHARRWDLAIPKYDAHLLKTWECAERGWCLAPGRVLFGNYTGQVSIRGMAELARGMGHDSG